MRSGSPRRTWYWRAILSATSTASEPPDVKMHVVEVARRETRDLGSARAIAGSVAKMLPTAYGSRAACSAIASTTSCRP